jgi:predicted O-methyltransferase YrrM
MVSAMHTQNIDLMNPRLQQVLNRAHHAAKGDTLIFLKGIPTLLGGLLQGKGVEAALRPKLKDAYIPINRRQGEVLYLLARAAGARNIVEFGSSFGLSTMYLAAAASHAEGGFVIGSEFEENKRAAATAHLEKAGLSQWADVRGGDAFTSLANVAGPIDLLFLDGWKDLYLPMLKMLEPKLRPGALVLADDTKPFRKALSGYLDYVRTPDNGYLSVDLPLGDGLEVSLNTRQRQVQS